VNLGRETTARAAECLAMLPPCILPLPTTKPSASVSVDGRPQPPEGDSARAKARFPVHRFQRKPEQSPGPQAEPAFARSGHRMPPRRALSASMSSGRLARTRCPGDRWSTRLAKISWLPRLLIEQQSQGYRCIILHRAAWTAPGDYFCRRVDVIASNTEEDVHEEGGARYAGRCLSQDVQAFVKLR
jgi:hypothetical protein